MKKQIENQIQEKIFTSLLYNSTKVEISNLVKISSRFLDILEEAMSPDAELFNIRAAIEGCVACWTYITESQMYVGNTGDAAAIIVQNLSKLK